MAKGVVYLRWHDGELVVQAAHTDVAAAQAQAAAEDKYYLGVFDGPGEDAKKLATVKGASNG